MLRSILGLCPVEATCDNPSGSRHCQSFLGKLNKIALVENHGSSDALLYLRLYH